MELTPEKDKATLFFLSPSAASICRSKYLPGLLPEIKTHLKAMQEKEAVFHEGRKLPEEQFIKKDLLY